MPKKKILVVEDDYKLRDTINDYLTDNDFLVVSAATGEAALRLFYSEKPDMILLDGMLPDIDGYDVLRKICETSRTPVIILSARESEEHQLAGFKAGADNYLVKPFLLSVLKEHINSLFARLSQPQRESISVGALKIDKDARKAYVDEKPIDTTPKEFEVLKFFAENEKIVLTREQILNAVWGYDYFGDYRTVDTIVKQLRRKLTDEHPYIKSLYGVGYCFEVTDEK